MATWRHISEALDSALLAAINGDEDGNPLADTRPDQGGKIEKLIPAGERCAAGERTAGYGGEEVPRTRPTRGPRPTFVIYDGRAVSHAAASGFPSPAARLSLVTVNGERVHSSALTTAS